ncbi:MAG: RNA methyltransferase [Coriobacteriia bacterium]|nr:RNA methyltransferase [Coriobacteriia bacterium]
MEYPAENIKLIRSRDNDFYKKLKSYGQSKYRKRDNCLIADGEKVYQEARSRLKLLYTIVSESYFETHLHPQIADEDGSKLTVFADNLFESLSECKTSQGILGVFEIPIFKLETATLNRVAVLEGIQDPKNVGAIIRNAHCLGYEAVFLGEGCATAFSPKVIRSSMGSVFHIPTLSADGSIEGIIQDLKAAGFSVVGTASSGSEEVRQFEKIALIIGSEGSGLSEQTTALCDHLFRIKISPSAESLNAAVASGIAMYVHN